MQSSGRRAELGRFLRDRRNRLHPADVGLAAGPRRRVNGLRREEVATLAGVGVTWYTMLENGSARGVSAATIDAVAGALHLTADELAYVRRLADDRALELPREDMRPKSVAVLAAIEWVPAYICTSHWKALAWNRAMSVVWGIERPGGAAFNIVARMFGDPALRAMHGDRFTTFAQWLVAMVRSGIASRIDDIAYRRMCDDLRCDPLFAQLWDTYDVAMPLGSLPTVVNSLAVGEFAYEAITLELPDDDGHWLVIQIPDAASGARLRAALAADSAAR